MCLPQISVIWISNCTQNKIRLKQKKKTEKKPKTNFLKIAIQLTKPITGSQYKLNMSKSSVKRVVNASMYSINTDTYVY